MVREDSESRGDALLTQLARDWQAAADPAGEAGARLCILRTAPIIDRANPPLKQMLPMFKIAPPPASIESWTRACCSYRSWLHVRPVSSRGWARSRSDPGCNDLDS